ncbi:phage tail fiber adhesin Gp38 [mine drainage metagenome]|uniref:Phage tail fiber adhesin Gp38 n=1 Tax=mine drainage metagenome TaxID=410659 RepID=A0A1J5SCF5_9ZZZZ
MLKNGFKKALRGFTLVEISIVLLIASILMMSYTRFLQDSIQDDKSAAIAAHLKTVTGGVNTYISSNFDALVSGAAISGVASPLLPTITELKNTGYLAQNVQTQNLARTNWLIQIGKTPTGCVAPACDLNAIVYSDKGFIKIADGRPDWMLASRTAGKVGGDGGTSLTSNLAVIAGENSSWTATNPVAASNAAAVVAMRTGYGSQGFSQFIRNGDTRNLTLNGALAINGASGVTATSANLGTLTASTITASGNITSAGNISATGKVSGAYIMPNTIIVAGTACAPGVANGSIAKGSDGSIYACVNGSWTSSSKVPPYNFNRVIAGNTTDYNLYNDAIASGWDGVAALIANVSVNGGVVVSGSSTSTYAFSITGNYPSGSSLSVVINSGAYVVGKGGTSGYGTPWNAQATNGGAGGNGMLITASPSANLKISNYGVIAGGGGGGGGGGANSGYWGVDGGGGAGYGLTSNIGSPYHSTNGSLTTGGPGVSGSGGNLAGWGGAGGALGMPGSSCRGPQGGAGYGGAAGQATVGAALATWLATGTRLGAVN